MTFGNQLSLKWQGLDMQELYSHWAEAMQDLTLGAVNFGIEMSMKETMPPNLGEFISHCKRYNPTNNMIKIESKLTTDQIEKNKKRIADIAQMLAKKKDVTNA